MSLFKSPKLWTPSGNRTPPRILRRPDARGLVTPLLDTAPLGDEVDYSDLQILSSSRVYEENAPGEVRYFMYELASKTPVDEDYEHFFKAVRFLRITRVPRYLRQSIGNGPNAIFEQQRDLLSALRENDVLFTQVISRLPNTPLIFAWGVQAIGETPLQAQANADEAFAVLRFQVEGVYQQLKYVPITLQEGEALTLAQTQWNNIAMARGRPVPAGTTGGANALLDGNRTDVESTNNQLESFIRGMADKSFLLTLTTVPINPIDMSRAWRNISEKLSAVRSDQEGSRSFSASVAIPLAMGSVLGRTEGDGHTTGTGLGDTTTHGTNESLADSTSTSHTQGVSHSDAVGHTLGTSQANSITHGQSLSDAINQGTTLGDAINRQTSDAVSISQGASIAESQQQGISESVGTSASESVGEAQSVQRGESATVSASRSLGESASQAYSWNTSRADASSINVGQSEGFSRSFADSLNQSFSDSWSRSNTFHDSIGVGETWGVSSSLYEGLYQGSATTQQTAGFGRQLSVGENFGHTTGAATTETSGTNASRSVSEGLSHTLTQGVGGSDSLTRSATNTVGESHSQSVSQSDTLSRTNTIGQSHTTGLSRSEGITAGRNIGESLTTAEALGRSSSLAQNVGNTQAVGQSLANTDTQGASQSQTTTSTAGTSSSNTQGVGQTATRGISSAQAQALSSSDAFMTSMARSASTNTSFGVAPALGLITTKRIFDEGKRSLGDLIENQRKRYEEGLNGAWLYQLSLVCPDSETLAGGAGLLKSAFWGAGAAGPQPQPFHVVRITDPEEKERLLQHTRAYSTYRRRELQRDLIEPFHFSSFLTNGEGSSFSHPPILESIGLLAQHDSMPVFAQPSDRQDRDIYMGHIINGERDEVTNTRFSLDISELEHVLISGYTGSGKTTSLLRFISEAARVHKEIVIQDPSNTHQQIVKKVPAGILALDWKSDLRNVMTAIPPNEINERFKFFSMSKPHLGRFRFNILALPDPNISPSEWINTVADLFMTSYELGEFARSLVWEAINDLYNVNRLEDHTLLDAIYEGDELVRPAYILPALEENEIPHGGIGLDAAGNEVANVFTCPDLSRLVSMQHVAVWMISKIEFAGTQEGARLLGTNYRDRAQTSYRRLMALSPGADNLLGELFAADPDLNTKRSLTVKDLVDPDKGLVTVIEADGLDNANRTFVLSGILLAVWRYGQYHGDGVFNQNGEGPGTFVVMEESHEIFGSHAGDEGHETSNTRNSMFESIFRRARSLGMHLVAVTQNPSSLPISVTAACSTVITHSVLGEADRKTIMSLFNWVLGIGQHYREYRYLGEMQQGNALIRLNAINSFLDVAPVHIRVDPTENRRVTDDQLLRLTSRGN